MIVKERYFRWEEGQRHSFCAERTGLSLFRRLAEDYLFVGSAPAQDAVPRIRATQAHHVGAVMRAVT